MSRLFVIFFWLCVTSLDSVNAFIDLLKKCAAHCQGTLELMN